MPNGKNGIWFYPTVRGFFRSTMVTSDWVASVARGSLHVEYLDDAGDVGHVLEGQFELPAAVGDFRE